MQSLLIAGLCLQTPWMQDCNWAITQAFYRFGFSSTARITYSVQHDEKHGPLAVPTQSKVSHYGADKVRTAVAFDARLVCSLQIIDESIQEAFKEQCRLNAHCAARFSKLFTAKTRVSDLESVQLRTSACL